MKKIIYIIVFAFLIQPQSILFSKKSNKRYEILFKDAIRNFNLKDSTAVDNPSSSPKKEKIKKKKVGKAILVNWSFIFADSVNYWSKYTKWLEDWQFTLTWKDQKRRFFTTEAIKFDSNPFMTNWTHGVSGAGFYSNARYYRLSIPESVLFSLASSLSWEYITEWREVISINDVFFSGIAGLHLGEPLFQISRYLLSKKGLANKIAGYLINPVFAVNDLIGSRKWRESFREDYNGHPLSYFTFGPENSRSFGPQRKDIALTHFGIGTSFLNIPGFNDETVKESYEKLRNTFYSRISFDISFSSKEVEEYRLETEAVLLGLSKKQIIYNQNEQSRGYKYYFGLSTAFELFKKKAVADYDKGEYHYDFTTGETPPQPTLFSDKFAIINLLGPAFNLSLFSGEIRADLSLNGWFDFALVNSLALNEYSKYYDLGDSYKKTTLTHYGYYYAFGYTLRGGLKLSFRNFDISGSLKYQRYSSIEDLDRFQDKIEDDSEVTDSRTISRIDIRFGIPKSPLSIVAAFENISRNGVFKVINYDGDEHRIYTQLRLSF